MDDERKFKMQIPIDRFLASPILRTLSMIEKKLILTDVNEEKIQTHSHTDTDTQILSMINYQAKYNFR